MKILSLFDGMSCGQIAFNSLGISIERYVAYEIDKYAIQTTMHNFPNTEQKGDVFEADFTEYEGFDFVVGGSPCTYWSIAQSSDKRETVTEAFGFEPVEINSALVSAQNRQRLYWVGMRNEGGQYDGIKVEQPVDRGILLRDILGSGVTWKEKSTTIDAHYGQGINLSSFDKQSGQRAMVAERIPEYANNEKSRPVCWSYAKQGQGQVDKNCFSDNPAKQQYDYVCEPINTTSDGKSQTLKAQYSKSNEQNFCCYSSTYGASGIAEPVGMREVGRRINEDGHRADDDKSIEAVQRYEVNENPQKTNTLTTVHKDNQICEPVKVGCYPSPDGTLKNSQGYRIYSVDAKATTQLGLSGGAGAKTGLYAVPIEFDENNIPTKAISPADNKEHRVYRVANGQITIKGKQYPIKLSDGYYIIRKLTVKECMRLQTVPDWYEFPVSDSQAYKCLGNGWTIEVIKHLIEATQRGIIADKQLTFF